MKHTPGIWHYEKLEIGYSATREEPGDPGCPAIVWAETEHGEIPIATLDDPIYRVEPEQPNEYYGDDGIRLCGDMNANAQLFAAAPDLLDALEADDIFFKHYSSCVSCGPKIGFCVQAILLCAQAESKRKIAIAKAKDET